jgi:hypothetical protein
MCVTKMREGAILDHQRHDQPNPEKSLPMIMKLTFTKKFCKQYPKAKQAIGFFRTASHTDPKTGNTKGFPVLEKTKTAIRNYLKKKKKTFALAKTGATVAVGKTYGGIAQASDKYIIDPSERGFHTPFVIASWQDTKILRLRIPKFKAENNLSPKLQIPGIPGYQVYLKYRYILILK